MTETAEAPAPKSDSKTQLLKRRIHEGVTLPSGAVVTIVLPNLGQMLKAGTLPNDLIKAALKQASDAPVDGVEAPKLTEEDLKQDWEFIEWIVPQTLHEPKIEQADVEKMDVLDITMIANFATRRTDLDAVGHQLGGLETQKSFRDHRGIIRFDEAVADLP